MSKLLFIFILFFSTNTFASLVSSSKDQELFKAIVFHYGELTKKIPEISEIKIAQNSNEYESIIRECLKDINAHDPDFLQDFNKKIKSGDHYQIDQAIRNAREVTLESFERLHSTGKYINEIDMLSISDNAAGVAVAVVVVAAVVAHNVVAVTAAAAVTVAVKIKVALDHVDPRSRLRYEKMVHSIATNLN